MTAADWQPITTAFIGAVMVALAALIRIYVPRGIAAFEKRTGVQVSAQQQADVYAAAQTAAGIIQTQLDQGALKLEHITPDNSAITDHAKAALASVGSTAGARSPTVATMARMIVGIVDTTAHPPPVPVPPEVRIAGTTIPRPVVPATA